MSSLITKARENADREKQARAAKKAAKGKGGGPVPPGGGGPGGRIAGGRWKVMAGRAVVWLLMLVLFLGGVRALVAKPPDADEVAAIVDARLASDAEFDHEVVSAFAARFARAYLSWDQDDPDSRTAALQPFLDPDASRESEQLGWSGEGIQRVVAVETGLVREVNRENAVVVVDALIEQPPLPDPDAELDEEGNPPPPKGQTQRMWMRLEVPVFVASDVLMAVAGLPAYLPTDRLVADLPELPAITPDDEAEPALSEKLDLFFKAYAGGEEDSAANLREHTVQDSLIRDLNGAVEFVSVDELVVPEGGNKRDVMASVTWKQGGALVVQTYRVAVERQDDRWYVADLSANPVVPLAAEPAEQ